MLLKLDRFLTILRGVPLPEAEWVYRRIAQYGLTYRVRFVEGSFKDAMPGFEEPLSLIKNDSALHESTLTALTYLWPRFHAHRPSASFLQCDNRRRSLAEARDALLLFYYYAGDRQHVQ